MQMNLRATARLALQLGIISEHYKQELRRWGYDIPEVEPLVPTNESALLAAFEEAALLDGFLFIQVTDLDAVRDFLRSAKKGTLTMLGAAPFEIAYAVRPSGDYLFPWGSGMDDIAEGLLHVDSVLRTAEGDEVRFTSTRDLFIGSSKVFLLASTRGVSHGVR